MQALSSPTQKPTFFTWSPLLPCAGWGKRSIYIFSNANKNYPCSFSFPSITHRSFKQPTHKLNFGEQTQFRNKDKENPAIVRRGWRRVQGARHTAVSVSEVHGGRVLEKTRTCLKEFTTAVRRQKINEELQPSVQCQGTRIQVDCKLLHGKLTLWPRGYTPAEHYTFHQTLFNVIGNTHEKMRREIKAASVSTGQVCGNNFLF